MPTTPRRAAAQQERERRQACRLRAAELFAVGVRQAEVARQLGVSAQAVSVWYGRSQAGGTDALRSRGPTGPAPKVSDAQLDWVELALLEGATGSGFTGELWTLDPIARLIQRLTGVRHHPAHVWALRQRLGWTVQRPVRRAAECDQARHRPMGQDAVAADQATTHRRRACLVFFDESALSLTPNVRRSWAPVGRPPVLQHPFSWKRASMAAALCHGVRGGGAQLAVHVQAGNDDTDSLIGCSLSCAASWWGEGHAVLGWLPAHPSAAMRAWLATQRSWLVVERLPADGPDATPVAGLWSSLKTVEPANLTVRPLVW